MIPEADILYRGTAAGTPAKRPPTAHCPGCGQIIDPVIEDRCADCAPATRLGTRIQWPAVEPGPITDESARAA